MASPQEKYYSAEDFYAIPEDIKAELINGEIVYMAAPSRLHQEISGELYYVIKSYIKEKKGKCRIFAAPFDVQLKKNENTVIEPDICVICDADKLTNHGCLGAPDWIIEITSPSNPSYDYITKLSLYHNAGVREYWIVDPQNETVYVYNMDGEEFSLKAYAFHEVIKANIYEDLYIHFSDFDLGVI